MVALAAVTTFRASAPLRATVAGAEVAPLSALLDTGCVSVCLAERARATVSRRAADHRSLVRGLGRALLVEPALEAAVDEGPLALEALVLRALAPGEPVEVVVESEDAPDLASLEARAAALAAALARLLGSREGAPRAATLAARAGSPLLGVPPGEGTCHVAVSSLEGWRSLEATDARWVEELLLFRDPHAPAEPSARLAFLAWHDGRHHEALREAARAARAGARVVARGRATFGALVEREARALAALAPQASRERLQDERLRRAGAVAVRRLGERGLILLVAPPSRHAALRAVAGEINLRTVSVTPAAGGVVVEELEP